MSDAKTMTVVNWITAHEAEALEQLKSFLRIPSISAQPDHSADMKRAADWLAGQLRDCGLTADVEPTGGHPVVLARSPHRPDRPTVLVYGHYDVQPAEPLEQWKSPPFEPTVRDGAIYARGAVDDKGQLYCHVQAIRAWQQAGGLPVNIIGLFEGEEEIGSSHLADFIRTNKQMLKADVAVISDTGHYARGVPSITYGLRGLCYVEVTVKASSHDLHSGVYGGGVPNPANVLATLLGGLIDADGRITVDGFYDEVVPLAADERAMWAGLPFDENKYINELTVPGLTGERGYTTLERVWARPTCDINGLTSGYQGAGAKTIIPAIASAKVSMRLVPNQDPRKIAAAFEKTLRGRCPKTVSLAVHIHSGVPASIVPRTGPHMQAAIRAVSAGFGKAPVLTREGGSIPVVGDIKRILGIDTLLVGFGLPDDRVHSPNEKFDLAQFYNGTRTVAVLYGELAAL